MELSNSEKYKIYLEEKEKAYKLEKEKLAQITEEQRTIIYNDYKEKNVVYVNQNDILYPKITLAVMSKIYGIGFGVLLLFNFVIALIWFIGVPIVLFVLYIYKSFVLLPELQYHCPKCNHGHRNRTSEEEHIETKSTGYIKACCKKCNENFHLIVEEKAFEILNIHPK